MKSDAFNVCFGGDDGGSGIGRLQADTVIGCNRLQLSLIVKMYW